MSYQADILVAGLPRSGTTLISNLLTDPSRRRWCVIEPGGFGAATQPRVYYRALKMGWDVASKEIKDVRAFLSTLDRWGSKEIRYWLIESAYQLTEPKHVLICARDMRDIAISFREFRTTQKKDPQSITQWLNQQAEHLTTNAVRWAHKVTVVYYERFVTDPDYRAEIARAIDWEFTGDPNRGLALFRRSDEVRDGIFSRRTTKDREQHRDLVEEVERTAGVYQRFFGYSGGE